MPPFGWICLVLSLALASHIAIGVVRREAAGRILFDLGRIDPDRTTPEVLLLGGPLILIGFLGVLLTGMHDFHWSMFTLCMLLGVNMVVTGMQRFLICEAGILSSPLIPAVQQINRIKLYRWDDILCYDLEKGKLRLKLRDQSPLGEHWITCRTEARFDYREQLDAVLASRCPRLRPPVPVSLHQIG